MHFTKGKHGFASQSMKFPNVAFLEENWFVEMLTENDEKKDVLV